MSFVDALLNHIDQERPAVRRGLARSLVYATASGAFATAAWWIGFEDAWPMAATASTMAAACFSGGLTRALFVWKSYAKWRVRRRVAENGVPRAGLLCLVGDSAEFESTQQRSVVVLLSHDADVSSDGEYMAHLAARAEQHFALARFRGRRSLPHSWTDGAEVDLMRIRISSAHLRRGTQGRHRVVCMVVPGERGVVVPVPAWIPSPIGQESRPAAGNRR